MVVVTAVHHTGVKLAQFDERVKTQNFLSRPDGVMAVREKDGPKSGGLPDGEKDNTLDMWRGRDLLPSGDQFPDGRRDEETFAGPVDRKSVCRGRSMVGVPGEKPGTPGVGRRGEGIQGEA